MGILNLNAAVVTLGVAGVLLLLNSSDAFSPSAVSEMMMSRAGRSSSGGTTTLVTRMANKEGLDGAQVTSARKELKFDDKTGRFFETNLATEECIPDEEFCPIDESTGKKIRLTVAEKERIFLDALQVR
jgi:hypothetical protein